MTFLLMLSTPGIFSDDILKYFSYFSHKTGFDISCTICMKCQILFSLKNKKNINNFSSAKLAQRVVKVNQLFVFSFLSVENQ